MTALPLLRSIYANEGADYETAYPTNMEPVAGDNGISKGYLRCAMGAEAWVSGPGVDRGGINWNGTLYRVMGSSFVSVAQDGTVMTIGDVGDDGNPVALDYGFSYLSIASNRNLWLYNGTALQQVTDGDLGPVIDAIWMDGYYVTTDGTSIVVTDLANPFSVNPLKYGSAEADPDPIVGLGRLRGELYAFGTNTIQVYSNQGGNLFPFQASPGATIPIGCVGPYAKVKFAQTYAFVGSGRNDAVGVWLMGQGTGQKLSTRAIDDMLAAEPNQSGIRLEARVSRDENRLYVHLSDKSLVYCAGATAQNDGDPVWYVCNSGTAMDRPYRLRNAVLAYGKLICGDTESNQLGIISEQLDAGDGTAFLSWSLDGETFSQEKALTLGKRGNRLLRPMWRPHVRFSSSFILLRFRGDNGQPQFGERTGWRVDCGLLYNQGNGAIIHDLELISLPARKAFAIASCEARIEGLGT